MLAEACKKYRFKLYLACMYIVYLDAFTDVELGQFIEQDIVELGELIEQDIEVKQLLPVLHSPICNAHVLPYIPIAFSHCHGYGFGHPYKLQPPK